MDSEIKIYDDLLHEEDSKFLLNSLLSERFPWGYGGKVVPSEMTLCDELDDFQFCNILYDRMMPISREEFDLVCPIINKPKLRIISVIRIKANLLPRRDRIIKHGFHTDVEFPCTTAIYYANTCNGYTEFEDGTIVESVQNRFVTFPSTMKHTGTTCTDAKTRIVINFNYFDLDEKYQDVFKEMGSNVESPFPTISPGGIIT